MHPLGRGKYIGYLRYFDDANIFTTLVIPVQYLAMTSFMSARSSLSLLLKNDFKTKCTNRRRTVHTLNRNEIIERVCFSEIT